jgi:hypothetical protein
MGIRGWNMKYAEKIDYLVSSIIYLGTHTYYWARSPDALASELSMDATTLEEVFQSFPGLFRKSHRVAENGQHYYALQARYAQREGGDTKDPETTSYIEPVDVDKLKMLLDFVMKMADDEKATFRGWLASSIAVLAAVLSAIAAVYAATLKH